MPVGLAVEDGRGRSNENATTRPHWEPGNVYVGHAILVVARAGAACRSHHRAGARGEARVWHSRAMSATLSIALSILGAGVDQGAGYPGR